VFSVMARSLQTWAIAVQTSSPLAAERELELLSRSGREDVKQSMMRLVNSFYRCRAVCHLHIHKRSNGQYYDNWRIERKK
jgi:hypothetical protein